MIGSLPEFGDLLQDTLAKCGVRRLTKKQMPLVLAALGGAAMGARPRLDHAMLARAHAAARAAAVDGSFVKDSERIVRVALEAALQTKLDPP